MQASRSVGETNGPADELDALIAAPANHQVLLENERVRIRVARLVSSRRRRRESGPCVARKAQGTPSGEAMGND